MRAGSCSSSRRRLLCSRCPGEFTCSCHESPQEIMRASIGFRVQGLKLCNLYLNLGGRLEGGPDHDSTSRCGLVVLIGHVWVIAMRSKARSFKLWLINTTGPWVSVSWMPYAIIMLFSETFHTFFQLYVPIHKTGSLRHLAQYRILIDSEHMPKYEARSLRWRKHGPIASLFFLFVCVSCSRPQARQPFHSCYRSHRRQVRENWRYTSNCLHSPVFLSP